MGAVFFVVEFEWGGYSPCLAWYNKKGGGVAQGLEQAAHNRLVAGSKPAAPTIA